MHSLIIIELTVEDIFILILNMFLYYTCHSSSISAYDTAPTENREIKSINKHTIHMYMQKIHKTYYNHALKL